MKIVARSVQSFTPIRHEFSVLAAQCPFCKSKAESEVGLVRCSSCRTKYHRECWQENRGCSVFGCRGTMIKVRGLLFSIPFLGIHFRLFQDPKWLMFLRFIVFGFYPCFALFRNEDLSFSLSDLFFLAWGSVCAFSVPLLFIVELACWWIVYEDSRLQEHFGKEMNHIISIAIYASAVGFVILSLLI